LWAAVPRIRGDALGGDFVSMVVSLTATPMMCAHLLKQQHAHGWLYRTSERFFEWIVETYGRTLKAVLRHAFITLVLLATIGLNVYLFIRIPKGFFPGAG
jgi:multidrug efflux pump